MQSDATNSAGSPPPCGEGSGVGVVVGRGALQNTPTSHPHPPPQGGRVQTEQAAPAPIRSIAYATPSIAREARADGVTILRATAPLAAYDPSLARLFRAAVETAPTRTFLAE